MKAWLAGALTVTLATSGVHAHGPQASPLDATLRSSSGKEAPLSKWRGKPVILFYEDKDSTRLNLALKEELFERGRREAFFAALSYVRDEENAEPQP